MRRATLTDGPAPAALAALFLAAGIWAGGWSRSGEWLALFGAALMLGFNFIRSSRGKGHLNLALLLLGFGWGRVRIARPAAAARDAASQIDISRPLEIDGILSRFWTGDSGARRSRLTAFAVVQDGRQFSFPAPVDFWLSGETPPPATRGDRIQAVGELRREDLPASARDLSVPFETYSFSCKSAWLIRRTGSTPLSVLAGLNDELNARLLAGSPPERNVAGPVAALLLGRTESLDDGLLDRLRRGGLYHVFVVSGLHVALFAALLAAALSGGGMDRKPRDVVLLSAVLLFALFAGARLSLLRAAVTLSILLLARIAEKPISVLQAVGVSALILLVVDPADLFSAGFFLSYSAAAGIALLVRPIGLALRFLPARIRTALAVSLAAQLATAPLILWRFNLVAAVGWLSTPLLLPVLAFLLVDGGILLFLVAAGLPGTVPARLFSLAERGMEGLTEKSGSFSFLAPTPPLATVILLLLLLFAVARFNGRARLAPLLAYALLFFVLSATARRHHGFSVEALDVGQGDAILLRCDAGAFLIDGGGSFDSRGEDFGRTRVVPKLLDRSITRLDGVMLSHPHPDHALGLFAVLREVPVGVFYRGGGDDAGFFSRLDALARQSGTAVEIVRPGQRLAWGGGIFTILRAGGRLFKTDPVNNESIVALFERDGRRILLTGDAGAPVEEELLHSGPFPGKVDVLKVGHHGSRTSSTREFVAALSPRAALLSCGRHNRFGHPSPQTVETFQQLRIPLFRTDLLSDVGIRLTAAHLQLFEGPEP